MRTRRLRADISALAADLRSFTSYCVDFDFSAPSSPFTLITKLYLSDPLLATLSCAWSRFFNPSTLPSLRSLKLLRFGERDFVLRGDEDEVTDLNDIFGPLLSLAP